MMPGSGFGIMPCCIAQHAPPAAAASTPRVTTTPPTIAPVDEPSRSAGAGTAAGADAGVEVGVVAGAGVVVVAGDVAVVLVVAAASLADSDASVVPAAPAVSSAGSADGLSDASVWVVASFWIEGASLSAA